MQNDVETASFVTVKMTANLTRVSSPCLKTIASYPIVVTIPLCIHDSISGVLIIDEAQDVVVANNR